MSSISFPGQPNGSRSSELHDDQFYTPSYDTSAFQMNPLSSHPPRTPRVSMNASAVHSSHMYHSATYEEEKVVEEPPMEDSSELDEDEDRLKAAERRLTREEVWREMFLTSYGRDKAFKLIQYSIRVFLVMHFRLGSFSFLRRAGRPAWNKGLVQRLQATASGLSFTRKCLLLFNWLDPLTTIMAQQRSVPFSVEGSGKLQPARPFLHTLLHASPPVLLEFVNGIADDVATWARVGLLGKKVGRRAEQLADWCWLFATLVALVENGVERQVITSQQAEVEGRLYAESMTGATGKSNAHRSKHDEKELSRLQKEDYWLLVSRAKLIMDLIFVSYSTFEFTWAADAVKAFAGLTAAVLSSSKFYDKKKRMLLKGLL